MKKSKMEMETLGKLLLLTAFLIIFLLMFKGCKDQMENVGMVGTNEYVCWFSHALKSEISFLFPSACYPIDVEKEQDKKGISILMRKCWWMHGQGEKDIVTAETNIGVLGKKYVVSWYDIARTCYIFTPKENINIQEFTTYLRKYDKDGKEVSGKEEDSKKTTWGYIQIQKISTEKTGICFDNEIPENTLFEGQTYYVIFYDDRGPISKGPRDRIMISRDPEFGADQTGFFAWVSEKVKKLSPFSYKDSCYNLKETIKEKVASETAYKIFDEVFTKFKTCSQTSITESCLCDDSEINLEDLPQDYEIRINRQDKNLYSIGLYKGTDVLKEESLDVNVGFWSNAKNDIETYGRTTTLPQVICAEGLGFKDLFSISRTTPTFSLVYNIDSRFYLNPPVYTSLTPPQEMVTLCVDIQKDSSGIYKGVYLFAHTFDAKARKFYLDPFKVPVLGYCSGKPVSKEAEEEIKRRGIEKQKETCEGYTESECYDHLDECYPYIPLTKFASCEYCGDFECQGLSETACKLIFCKSKKPCKWVTSPGTPGGVCYNV